MAAQATLDRLFAEFDSPPEVIASIVALLEDQASPAFIARYRREASGGLGEDRIHAIAERWHALDEIEQRKQAILQQAQERGRLTPELEQLLADNADQDFLDDLYQSMRPRRRNLAMQMEEKGLLPLALAIQHRQLDGKSPHELAQQYLAADQGLETPEAVLEGTLVILADRIAHDATTRARARDELRRGILRAAAVDPERAKAGAGRYQDFFEFAEPINRIPPGRMLALRRAEREGIVKLELALPEGRHRELLRELHASDLPEDSPFREFYDLVFDQAWQQLQEVCGKDVRRRIKERADREAVRTYARNLRSQLLAPALGSKKVLVLRTSSKSAWAVLLGEDGAASQYKTLPLDTEVQRLGAMNWLADLLANEQPAAIAVPHGRRQAGSEKLVAQLRRFLEEPAAPATPDEPAASPPAEAPAETPAGAGPTVDAPQTDGPQVADAVVSSDAASVEPAAATASTVDEPAVNESTVDEPAKDTAPATPATPRGPVKMPMVVAVDEAASTIFATGNAGKKAMPGIEVGVRTAISIGRRLQDPLLELARMDARTLGLGQTLDDVHQGMLQRELHAVTSACLALVGIDLNTVDVDLLALVPGVTREQAEAIVSHRRKRGGFSCRADLNAVEGLSASAVRNIAGFLRIQGGSEPLDASPIHPDDYELVRRIAEKKGVEPVQLLGKNLRDVNADELVTESTPRGHVVSVLQQLQRANEDVRGELVDTRNEGVHTFADLHSDRELRGRVANLTEFGAFVDLGIGQDGLVHISQIPNHRLRDPQNMLCVGEVVTVWVLHVDQEKHKISLTMHKPRHLQEGRLPTIGERMEMQQGRGRRRGPRGEGGPRGPGGPHGDNAPRHEGRPRGDRPERPGRAGDAHRLPQRRGPGDGPGGERRGRPGGGDRGERSGGDRGFGDRGFGDGDRGRGRGGPREQRVYTVEPAKEVVETRTAKGEVTSLAGLRNLFGGGKPPAEKPKAAETPPNAPSPNPGE